MHLIETTVERTTDLVPHQVIVKTIRQLYFTQLEDCCTIELTNRLCTSRQQVWGWPLAHINV